MKAVWSKVRLDYMQLTSVRPVYILDLWWGIDRIKGFLSNSVKQKRKDGSI